MKRLLVWFALSSMLGACSWKKIPETPVVSEGVAVAASTLGPGDVVEIKVYDEAELSGIFAVGSGGTVNYPLIGRLAVEGMTSSDLAETLQKKLGEKFLRNPQVSIIIREYNSKKVSVFGEVNKPGTFRYEDNMTIIQAVSMAGGFTKMASKNQTNVTRLENGEERKFFVPVEAIAEGKTRNFFLRPGDIVYVPESIW
ncbi:MAG: polysaccharide export protein [Myxococcales bacterium]|nr:polysaccharide export protein [Myxococcales bacterium]